MNEPTILHPEQAEDLRRLLGLVEDWLLHASFEVLGELGGFLTGLGWGRGASPERMAAQLISDLGEVTITLRTAPAAAPGGGGGGAPPPRRRRRAPRRRRERADQHPDP